MIGDGRMKKVHWVLGVILSLAVILILLITSFQAAMYADFSFYEKEYEKNPCFMPYISDVNG